MMHTRPDPRFKRSATDLHLALKAALKSVADAQWRAAICLEEIHGAEAVSEVGIQLNQSRCGNQAVVQRRKGPRGPFSMATCEWNFGALTVRRCPPIGHIAASR